MEKITDKKKVKAFVLLFSITYMISYITRINYGAVISEMQASTGISKSLLSMALTGSFITYGIGQIISGIIGDKISPKRLISIGFFITVIMNFLIPLYENPYYMLCVWSINGFAQSFMWPPLVKIMSGTLSDLDYSNAVTKVSYGSSVGTIFVYLLSPVLIMFAGWKAVFFTSSLLGVVMLFVWNKFACDAKITPIAKQEQNNSNGKWFSPLVFGIMLAIILQGSLRDGITTWMPSYISETYNLGNAISILTGVLLPIFGILCFTVATKLYVTKLKNPLFCSTLFFGGAMLFALCLYIFTGKNAVISIVMSALLTGCMHSVNLMLICMVPNYFKSTGKVSTVSGVLNSCTYIGSAISSYGIAFLSDNFGWSFTLIIWLAITVLGTVITFVCGRKWNND